VRPAPYVNVLTSFPLQTARRGKDKKESQARPDLSETGVCDANPAHAEQSPDLGLMQMNAAGSNLTQLPLGRAINLFTKVGATFG
jgi:hypothetical protein